MDTLQNIKLAAWTVPTGEPNIPAQLVDLEEVFKNVVNVVLGFAGLAFFVLLLVGGFKFMTAGGDPKAIDSARKTLTSAVAGLLIVILAYLVLVFIEKITGVDLTKFRIVNP
ncbi:MAG: hypothetical protein Q8P91_00915 [bacterium]|nr:hypothetical protein [bacterium]